MTEFERLKNMYRKQSMQLLNEMVTTNDEVKDNVFRDYWSGNHPVPHVNYRKVLKLALKYATDGYNDPEIIDIIIATRLTCPYNIYDFFPRGRCAGECTFEARSDGESNTRAVINFLSKVDDSKFPQLKSGIIRIIKEPMEIGVTGYFSAEDTKQKFDFQNFIDKNIDKLSPAFQEELFAKDDCSIMIKR